MSAREILPLLDEFPSIVITVSVPAPAANKLRIDVEPVTTIVAGAPLVDGASSLSKVPL